MKRGRSRFQAESYQDPQTSGDVYEEEFDRFAARLRDRTLDFVLQRTRGPKGADDHVFADLNVEVLFDDHLVVAAGKQSRWARRRKIDLAELVNEPWILAEPVTWNYRLISEAFRMRGWDMPRISVRTLSTHMRTNMLASGRFIATFPNSVLQFYAERFSLKALPVGLPIEPWPVVILTLKDRTLSPVVQVFLAHLRNTMTSMVTKRP